MLPVSTSRNDCTLGVMYITQVCRVAYMHLSNVRKICNMLTVYNLYNLDNYYEAASQLIHSFITSRIDYCKKIQSVEIETILVLISLKNYIGYQLDSESPIKLLC